MRGRNITASVVLLFWSLFYTFDDVLCIAIKSSLVDFEILCFNCLLILYYVGTCVFLDVFIYIMIISYLIEVPCIHSFEYVLYIAMDLLGIVNALF